MADQAASGGEVGCSRCGNTRRGKGAERSPSGAYEYPYARPDQ